MSLRSPSHNSPIVAKSQQVELHWEIGSGAFGSVWHGSWNTRPVAVKKLVLDGNRNKLIDIVHYRNYKLVADLQGVYFEDQTSEDETGVAMNREVCSLLLYAGDRSLTSYLQAPVMYPKEPNEPQRLSWYQKRVIFMELCSAIHAMHQHGIIHGDIKSDNVVLSGIGSLVSFVMIADFNVSARNENFRNIGRDPRYVAPERWRSKDVENRQATDVYSLGIVLWEIATDAREKPYAGMSKASLNEKANEKYRFSGKHLHELMLALPSDHPQDICDVIRWCCAFDPEDRPLLPWLIMYLEERVGDWRQGRDFARVVSHPILTASTMVDGAPALCSSRQVDVETSRATIAYTPMSVGNTLTEHPFPTVMATLRSKLKVLDMNDDAVSASRDKHVPPEANHSTLLGLTLVNSVNSRDTLVEAGGYGTLGTALSDCQSEQLSPTNSVSGGDPVEAGGYGTLGTALSDCQSEQLSPTNFVRGGDPVEAGGYGTLGTALSDCQSEQLTPTDFVSGGDLDVKGEPMPLSPLVSIANFVSQQECMTSWACCSVDHKNGMNTELFLHMERDGDAESTTPDGDIPPAELLNPDRRDELAEWYFCQGSHNFNILPRRLNVHVQAHDFLVQAAKLGHAHAQDMLHELWFESYSRKEITWYNGEGHELRENKHPIAAVRLSKLYTHLNIGHSDYVLGRYYDAIGDEAVAVKHYRRSASKGHGNAAIFLIDYKLYKSADKGHVCNALELYLDLLTVKLQLEVLDDHFPKRAELAALVSDVRQMVMTSDAAAIPWWRKLADMNLGKAQIFIAYCYEHGLHGVEKNLPEALQLYSLAQKTPDFSEYGVSLQRWALCEEAASSGLRRLRVTEELREIGVGAMQFGFLNLAVVLLQRAADLGDPEAISLLMSMNCTTEKTAGNDMKQVRDGLHKVETIARANNFAALEGLLRYYWRWQRRDEWLEWTQFRSTVARVHWRSSFNGISNATEDVSQPQGILPQFVLLTHSDLSVVGDATFPFHSTNESAMNNSAYTLLPLVRLTDAAPEQVGAVWTIRPICFLGGFACEFSFRMTNGNPGEPAIDGSEGMAFVLQAHKENAIGKGEWHLGFSGIKHSHVWSSGDLCGDPNGNHISIQTSIGYNVMASHEQSLGCVTELPPLNDGGWYTARILYLPENGDSGGSGASDRLEVWLSTIVDENGFGTDYVCVVAANELHLRDIIGKDEAWIGLTASTGKKTPQCHEVASLRFTEVLM
ncbi:hypothetical protein BC938DRAFT_482722 [Jimgerdemannia flammicorona]|uniref:Protein kinase domain-containing protein n=1 Tax=Jimgerdemannia flammicorona TaxID=994334 RepID=A0A433QWA1_9FUNG|nr:hypothetical protein BC938DRAFT_482722 [Jimgerdemannia flammicorona]